MNPVTSRGHTSGDSANLELVVVHGPEADFMFWTAESTERISRSRDGLAFAGLM